MTGQFCLEETVENDLSTTTLVDGIMRTVHDGSGGHKEIAKDTERTRI
jgi:hypothetical protein